MKIPIKVKQVTYSKNFVTTSGGIYTSAVLNISDERIEITHKGFKLLKYVINHLPIKFEKNIREPEEIYINQFKELKIKYPTTINNCELSVKMNTEDLAKISGYLDNWQKQE